MSGNDKNVDECKNQDEVFRGYLIRESTGIIFDFDKMNPVFVSQSTLLQILSEQEEVIMITLSKGSRAANQVYFASRTDPKDRPSGCEGEKLHEQNFALSSLDSSATVCNCDDVTNLQAEGWICYPNPTGPGCQCQLYNYKLSMLDIVIINSCG